MFLRALSSWSIALLTIVPPWPQAISAQDKQPLVSAFWPPSGMVGQPWPVQAIGVGPEQIRSIVVSQERVRSSRAGLKNDWTFAVEQTATDFEFDAWVVTGQGMSAARRAAVSHLTHQLEIEPNNELERAQSVDLPGVVLGKIDPGTDCDIFRFALHQGDVCSIRCRSRTLEGELSPVMTLVGPTGRELDHYDGAWLDAWLHIVARETGAYQVMVQDRAYRKAPGNFYELSITTGPALVAASPTVLQRGRRQKVTLYGYALPGAEPATGGPAGLVQKQIELDVPEHGDLDGGGWSLAPTLFCQAFAYRVPGALGSVRLQLVDGPVTMEIVADNDARNRAQPLSLPCELAGSFGTPADVDWYRFSAKQGEVFWLEAFGERLGLPMDIELAVHDAQGNLLETLSDTVAPKGKTLPLEIESLDPAGVWKAPAAGDYLLAVRDLYGATLFGADRQYHVLIGPRREQLALASTRSGGVLGAGAHLEIPLAAIRRNGHEEPIRVCAVNLPAGVSAAEVVIGKKESTGTLKLSAAKDAAEWTGTFAVEADTKVDGRDVRLSVRSGSRSDDKSAVRFCAAFALAVRSAEKPAAKGK